MYYNSFNYQIATTPNPSNGDITRGSGTYLNGLSREVRATLNTGNTFVNRTENGIQVSAIASNI